MTIRYSTAGLAVLILLLSQPAGFADDGHPAGLFVEVVGEVSVQRAKSPETPEPKGELVPLDNLVGALHLGAESVKREVVSSGREDSSLSVVYQDIGNS